MNERYEAAVKSLEEMARTDIEVSTRFETSLLRSNLDSLVKLLIAKGVISEQEHHDAAANEVEKLNEFCSERANRRRQEREERVKAQAERERKELADKAELELQEIERQAEEKRKQLEARVQQKRQEIEARAEQERPK